MLRSYLYIWLVYLYMLVKNTKNVSKIDNIVTNVDTSLANFGLENIVEKAKEKFKTVLLYRK